MREPEEEGEELEETFYGSSNNRMLRATAAREESNNARRSLTKSEEAHRRLAQEVSEGIAAAYDRDPDMRAKGEDVRLLTVSAVSDVQSHQKHEMESGLCLRCSVRTHNSRIPSVSFTTP